MSLEAFLRKHFYTLIFVAVIVFLLPIAGFFFFFSDKSMNQIDQPNKVKLPYLKQYHEEPMKRLGQSREQSRYPFASESTFEYVDKFTEGEKSILLEAYELIIQHNDGTTLATDLFEGRFSGDSAEENEEFWRIYNLIQSFKILKSSGFFRDGHVQLEIPTEFHWDSLPTEFSPFLPIARRFGDLYGRDEFEPVLATLSDEDQDLLGNISEQWMQEKNDAIDEFLTKKWDPVDTRKEAMRYLHNAKLFWYAWKFGLDHENLSSMW
jgi:hypothetical protein